MRNFPSVAMHRFDMEGRGSMLVGDLEMAPAWSLDKELDKECVCGTGLPLLQKGGTVSCCCCCRVSFLRLPEIVFLSVMVFFAVSQYICGAVAEQYFALSLLLRSRSGLLFSLLLLCFLPVTMAIGCWHPTGTCDQRSVTRFRCGSFVVVALCLCLNLASILVVWPEAQGLEAAILAEFGASDPPDPAEWPLSVDAWMFQPSTLGPYRSIYEEFSFETYTFLSVVQRRQGWTESCGGRPFLDSLAMDVFSPSREDGQLAPIIFNIHGGGFLRGDKDHPGLEYYSYFVDRGYALVSPQYGFICDGFSAFDMVDQLTKAFDYVRANATKWGMDPKRIFVSGQSAGGHLALMLAYTLNSPVCGGWRTCGIKGVYNQYGVATPIPLPEGKRDRLLADTLHGTSNSSQAYLAYPIAHVANSSPPTLSHHGSWDSVVPYSSSIALHTALRDNGVKEYLMALPTFEHVCEYGYWQGCAQLFRFAFERFLALRDL